MSPGPDTVRVLTLNLWHTPVELERRLDAAAAEIRDRRPHVVCLQEVMVRDDGWTAAVALAARVGMKVAASGGGAVRGALGERSGLAVLTNLPVTDVTVLDLPTTDAAAHTAAGVPDAALVVATRTPAGRPLLVATTHLAWGGRRENVRLAQVRFLDRHLDTHPLTGDGAVVVWTGDFNTGPESDSLRFLTGLGVVEGTSTYWTDAWAAAGDGPGHTSGPDNPWASATARQVGITRPELLPHRRIDFCLVRDFAYGRPGAPLAARLAHTVPHLAADGTATTASDHWGVEVDLWDPPHRQD